MLSYRTSLLLYLQPPLASAAFCTERGNEGETERKRGGGGEGGERGEGGTERYIEQRKVCREKGGCFLEDKCRVCYRRPKKACGSTPQPASEYSLRNPTAMIGLWSNYGIAFPKQAIPHKASSFGSIPTDMRGVLSVTQPPQEARLTEEKLPFLLPCRFPGLKVNNNRPSLLLIKERRMRE